MSFLQLCLGLTCASGILLIIWQIAIRASKYMISHADAPPGLPLLEDQPSGVKVAVQLSDGTTIPAWHRGSGPAVIIVPDAGFSVSAYTPLWSLLCGYGFRVVIFQPRSIHKKISLESRIGELESVIRQLNIHQPVILGHGFGAYLGLWHQQQGSSSMLRTPASGLLAVCPFAGKARQAFPFSQKIRRLLHTATRYQKGLSAFGESASAAGILALKQHTNYFPWEYLHQTWPELEAGPMLDEETTIQIVCPATDEIIPFTQTQRFQEAHPAASLDRIFDGSGHMLIWEKPSLIVDQIRWMKKRFQQASNTG